MIVHGFNMVALTHPQGLYRIRLNLRYIRMALEGGCFEFEFEFECKYLLEFWSGIGEEVMFMSDAVDRGATLLFLS